MEYVLVARLVGLYLMVECLIVSLNPIPDTAEKWKAKKQNMLRRIFYLLALIIAVVWIVTL